MLKGKVSVTSKVDKTRQLKQAIKTASDSEVYVGIPQGDVGSHPNITAAELLYALSHGVRKKGMRDEMDNYMGVTPDGMPIMRDFNTFLSRQSDGMPYSAAYDLFLHENGSPLWHIPPRPVLEPAISYNKEFVAKQLKNAAIVALDGQDPSNELAAAGMMAVNVVKDWFTNPANHWPPNSPITIEMKGSDRPLIDTHNLMNTITYVVRENS